MELVLVIAASLLYLGCVPLQVFGQSRLSQSEKQEILEIHNSLRGSVNPSAANMGVMVWATHLAVHS
jgi:ABC-type oligopeptide transport system substrate-binding subunit